MSINISDELLVAANARDSSSDDDDSPPIPLTYWPHVDVRGSSRKLKEKLAALGCEKEQKMGIVRSSAETMAAYEQVFGSDDQPGLRDFDFAASIDDSGPGGMRVLVDAPLKSTFESSSRAWQRGYQQRRAMASQKIDTAPIEFLGLSPGGPRDRLPTENRASMDQQFDPATMGLFALLPGELRNRIYRLALVMPFEGQPYPITMPEQACSLGPCIHSQLPTALPSLLSTCRQIRTEALPIFIAENAAIGFDTRMVEARCTANWVRCLGPYAGSIKRMDLGVVVCTRWEIPRSEWKTTLICPDGHAAMGGKKGGAGFGIEIDGNIEEKDRKGCRVLNDYVGGLTKRFRKGEKAEVLIEEFVGSDLLAEVVWKCKK